MYAWSRFLYNRLPYECFYRTKNIKLPTIQFFVPTIQKLILQGFFFQIFVMLLIEGISISFYRWLLLIDFQNKNQRELVFFMSIFLQEIPSQTKPRKAAHT